MGIVAYSLFWVMQDLYHQLYESSGHIRCYPSAVRIQLHMKARGCFIRHAGYGLPALLGLGYN